MSFRRQIAPLVGLEGAEFDRAMSGIGMTLPYPVIEDVLFFACGARSPRERRSVQN